jgi:hypothetical protein
VFQREGNSRRLGARRLVGLDQVVPVVFSEVSNKESSGALEPWSETCTLQTDMNIIHRRLFCKQSDIVYIIQSLISP